MTAPKTVKISRTVAELLSGWFSETKHAERCGVMVGPEPVLGGTTVEIDAVKECRNVAEPPFFAAHPEDLYAALRETSFFGGAVIDRRFLGLAHTHPHNTAVPSRYDAEAADQPLVWIISGTDGLKAYWTDGDGTFTEIDLVVGSDKSSRLSLF